MTARSPRPPARGDVWTVDLDPARGHEQAGRRPALVVSVDGLNAGPSGLVIAIPITTKEKVGIPFHVQLVPPEGGLPRRSWAKTEDVRSISVERLSSRLGSVSLQTMDAIEDRLRVLLGL